MNNWIIDTVATNLLDSVSMEVYNKTFNMLNKEEVNAITEIVINKIEYMAALRKSQAGK